MNHSITARPLQQVIQAQETRDGAGVKILRIAGRQYYAMLDPFLLIDEIRSDTASDYSGGFPPHPHRGFETITYMLDGCFRHRDHLGNEGLVRAGGAQWMTAGRGIIHSEMPEQEDGAMHGFQLWLNLPAADKLSEPCWRDVQAGQMATAELDNGAELTVLAGSLRVAAGAGQVALQGPIITVTRATIADIRLPVAARIDLQLEAGASAAVRIIEGALPPLQAGQLGVFAAGDTLRLMTTDQAARLLLLSGQPLREPIVQYGPFVMNTMEEIETAISDYQNNRLVG